MTTTTQALRPYQVETLRRISAARVNGQNRVLVQSATGTGKTSVLSQLTTELHDWLETLPAKQRKLLVIAHREELIDQSAVRLRQNNPGMLVSIEQGDRVASIYSDAIVASIQTLDAGERKRLKRLLAHMQFAIVVVDECHHASANSYRRVLAELGFIPDPAGEADFAQLPDAIRAQKIEARTKEWDAVAPQDRLLVGFTATPNRSDSVGLSVVFQTIAFSYPMRQAITDGWLAPIRALAVASTTSLENVRTTAGEFNQKDLAEAVNTPNRNLAALMAWKEHAVEAGVPRATLGFTVDVAHAHAAAELWQQAGYRFEAISGQTPNDDRKRLLRQYTEGQIDGLFNAMLLTEGTDLPRTACIQHLKPTKSATLYEQMTGRGLRLFKGKTDCLVLDMVDISRRHSLMAAPMLYGLPPLLNAKGQTLEQLEDDVTALREAHPGLDIDALLSSLTDMDKLKARLEAVNVFDVQPIDPAILQATALDWVRTGDTYRLSYPWQEGQETVTVGIDMLGHWDVWVTYSLFKGDAPRQRTIVSQVSHAALAAMQAEQYVTQQRGSVAKMKDRNAAWKTRPATEKQKSFLARLRVPFNANTLTSGQAGALIDRAMHGRGRR